MAKKENASSQFDAKPTKKIDVKKEDKRSTRNTLVKVINFLNEKYDFRYNEINTDTEYKQKNQKEFRYFDDMDYRDVYLKTIIDGDFSISDQSFKSIIYSRSVSKIFNPFKEYFKEVEGSWDGKSDMIRMCLEQVYLKEEKHRDMFIKHFKKWFVALIMSLITDVPSPFNVNQTCLILVGSQGRYKTTFLKNLIPSSMQLKYFYGSSFQPHNKDHEKYLAYKMLINFDEMAAFNKTDIETIKSKLSQDQIVVRLPYAKADIHLKRRASFCGTENNREILKDMTGSRRWLVFEVDKININQDFDIAAMYAQGLKLFKEGFKYWFDEDDIRYIEGYNDQYTFKGFEEELVMKHYIVPVDNDYEMNKVEYLNATDIATDLAKKYEKINVNNTIIKNIGQAMRKLGFIKRSRRITGYDNPIPLWAVRMADYPGRSSSADITNIKDDGDQGEIF